MRLLFVSRAYHPAVGYGGPVVSLRRICSMLAAAGHEVRVVCSDMASPGRTGKSVPAGRYDMEGVGVEFVRTPLRYHWEGIAPRGPSVLSRAVAGADVVHVAGTRHFLGVVAELTARRQGKPYLVMPEGSIPPRFRNTSGKRFVDAIYTRPSLNRACRVVATSDTEAEELARWGVTRERLLILPPRAERIDQSVRPREELRRERGLPVDAPVLFWMGRIHAEKGLPLLLEALADHRLSDAHLLLAGDAEDVSLARSLRRRAADPPLRGRVRFVGWIGHEQKTELLKLSDLFVFPSRKENFGLAVAEAVASGLPVVVTESCGIAGLVADGGAGLVCSYDSGSIADTVARAIGDPELLSRLRQGTGAVASRLDWPPVVGYLEQVYGEAVAAKRS